MGQNTCGDLFACFLMLILRRTPGFGPTDSIHIYIYTYIYIYIYIYMLTYVYATPDTKSSARPTPGSASPPRPSSRSLSPWRAPFSQDAEGGFGNLKVPEEVWNSNCCPNCGDFQKLESLMPNFAEIHWPAFNGPRLIFSQWWAPTTFRLSNLEWVFRNQGAPAKTRVLTGLAPADTRLGTPDTLDMDLYLKGT